jgi:hypothetical protein
MSVDNHHSGILRTTVWYVGDVVFEILWTEDSETHIARHRITAGEVEDAIYSRPRWIAPGRSDTRLVFAQTSAGRYLLVVLAEALDGRDYGVTARDMTDTERHAFTEKGR